MIRSRFPSALVVLALALFAPAGLAQERAADAPEADPYLERVARLVELETSLAAWTGDRDDAWRALAEEAEALREEVRLGAEDRLRETDPAPTPVDPRLRLERERNVEVARPLEPETRIREEVRQEVHETDRESLERLPEATREEALERRLRTLRERARAEEIRRRMRERAVELRERRAEELREQSRERVRDPVRRPR